MHLSEGTVFHGLTLLCYCGGGAFGDVYYCEDITGRHLAVKIIWKQKIGNDWKRELQGVANYQKITAQTENLLKIFHIEDDEECFFYTMEAADSRSQEEYVPDTLGARLASGPLRPEETFGILHGIFKGVKTLHEAGFVHRDIKPENILFVQGKPKLGDIGLLSSLSITVTQVAGTLEFLPPEVRSGEGDASDRLSRRMNDLYALGKVMYCSVTGGLPQNWPTVPRPLPLTLTLKYFLRLSLRLCDRDPERRLVRLEELSREFSNIERKLMYGETLGDKIAFLFGCLSGGCKRLYVHLKQGIVSHWALISLSILLVGGVGVWVGTRAQHKSDGVEQLVGGVGAVTRSGSSVPPGSGRTVVEEAPLVVKSESQTYVNERLGFQLTFPLTWSIFTVDTLLLKLRELESKPMSALEKKRLAILKGLLSLGGEIMVYTGEGNQWDSITVQPLPSLEEFYKKISMEECKKVILDLYRGELELDTEVYDIQRTTFKGIPAIRVELSHDPKKFRSLTYVLLRDNACVSICLTALLSSYEEREREFLKILDTFRPWKKKQ